jgi:hypothetical protein
LSEDTLIVEAVNVEPNVVEKIVVSTLREDAIIVDTRKSGTTILDPMRDENCVVSLIVNEETLIVDAVIVDPKRVEKVSSPA